MARKCIEDPWNREKGGEGGKERSGYFPFLWQNTLFRKKKQQTNFNFCNSYKPNSREKNPWSATRPLVSNWTESFPRILSCSRGYHQSYYPRDLCHRINQTFICNSISTEETWQKLQMNRQLCWGPQWSLSPVSATHQRCSLSKASGFILSNSYSNKKRQ